MRITVWGINYYPELVGIAVYNTDLCEFLADQGHQVRMVTGFPYYPNWKKLKTDQSLTYRTDMISVHGHTQVEVCRCWLYVPAKLSASRRIVHEASFVFTSLWALATKEKPDLYFVVLPPLLLGFAAWVIKLFKPAPVFLHVQDLQPDAAVSLGMLRAGPLLTWLYALEKFVYAKADRVSSISQEMCETIKSRTTPGKVFFLPNWVSLPQISALPDDGTWKTRHGIAPQILIVSYAGNLGVKQGLEIVVEIARLLKDRDDVLFVIAGNGGEEMNLKRLAATYNLQNIRFENVLSDEEHTALIVDSALCLIPQKPGSSANFLPSKLLKILALARPIITNADPGSSLYNAVIEGGFGKAVPPGDVAAMVKALAELLSNPAERKEAGALGRQYVIRFEKEAVLSNLETRLLGLGLS